VNLPLIHQSERDHAAQTNPGPIGSETCPTFYIVLAFAPTAKPAIPVLRRFDSAGKGSYTPSNSRMSTV
jgi:hypothetical protein